MTTRTMIVAAALALAVPGSALAQASGDGFQGPRVFGGQALDQSLSAMNRELGMSYQREDVISGLVTTEERDFSTLTVALRDAGEEPAEDAPQPAEFAAAISGDAGLQTVVGGIGQRIADDSDDLAVRLKLSAAADLDAPQRNGFGPVISGDATLEAKVVHIFDLVGATEALPQTVAVREFNDASLDAYIASLSTPPIDL